MLWLSVIFRIKLKLLFLALPTPLTSSAFSALLVYSPATWAFFFTHRVIKSILFWGFGVAIVFFFLPQIFAVLILSCRSHLRFSQRPVLITQVEVAPQSRPVPFVLFLSQYSVLPCISLFPSWLCYLSSSSDCEHHETRDIFCVVQGCCLHAWDSAPYYVYVSRSVVSNSLWPHGLYPSRPLCPWDFPGKNKLLFPSPGDLPNPGIEPRSPTLQANSLPSESPGKLYIRYLLNISWVMYSSRQE